MKINGISKKAKPTNKTENFLGKILVGGNSLIYE